MAANSLPQNEWERNRHLEIVEDLSEYVSKIKALVEIGLNCSLDNLKPETMYNYLLEIGSLVHSVEIVLEDLLP